MGMPGTVTTEHTFWCGTCSKWYQACNGKLRLDEKEVRDLGWGKTTDRGWLCPSCIKDRRHFKRDERYGDKRYETAR